MEMNLLSTKAEKIFQGEGGEYRAWTPTQLPLLAHAKVSGGVLLLHPLSFALPHYADSSKIGYVSEGTHGVVGMLFPNTTQEKVVQLRKGDAIAVPKGVISWWFNDATDSDLHVVFLGETQHSLNPGQFTYFSLTGTLGMLQGFSSKFVDKLFTVDDEQANQLFNSQQGQLIIKLKEGQTMPTPSDENIETLCVNFDDVMPDSDIKFSGKMTNLTGTKFPSIGSTGLSATRVVLEPGASHAPMFALDGATRLTYVVKGSGRVQIVGANGKNVLDTNVETGHLFIVPGYFVCAYIAGESRMECFSVTTTSEPKNAFLAGETSVWRAISTDALEVSLNVNPKLRQLFISNLKRNPIINPPSE